MIVVAIVGILSMFAAPAMRSMLANNQVNSMANKLLIDIMYARNLAVTENIDVAMVPRDQTPGTGTLVGTQGANWAIGWTISEITADPNPDPPARVFRTQASFGPGAVIRSVNAANVLDIDNPIGFNAGGFSQNPGTLQIAVAGCTGGDPDLPVDESGSGRQLQINFIGQVIVSNIGCPDELVTQ